MGTDHASLHTPSHSRFDELHGRPPSALRSSPAAQYRKALLDSSSQFPAEDRRLHAPATWLHHHDGTTCHLARRCMQARTPPTDSGPGSITARIDRQRPSGQGAQQACSASGSHTPEPTEVAGPTRKPPPRGSQRMRCSRAARDLWVGLSREARRAALSHLRRPLALLSSLLRLLPLRGDWLRATAAATADGEPGGRSGAEACWGTEGVTRAGGALGQGAAGKRVWGRVLVRHAR